MSELQTLIDRLDMLTAGNREAAADALGVSKVTAASYRHLNPDQPPSQKYQAAILRLKSAVDRLSREKGVIFNG